MLILFTMVHKYFIEIIFKMVFFIILPIRVSVLLNHHLYVLELICHTIWKYPFCKPQIWLLNL